MNTGSTSFVVIAFLAGCGQAAPAEPLGRSNSPVVATPRIDGYFSVGCTASQTVEERLVERGARRGRAVVLGRPLEGARSMGERRTFAFGQRWHTEYMVHYQRVRVDRILHDPSNLVAVSRREIEVYAIDPETEVRVDDEGRRYVPFPGSEFAPPPDARSGAGHDSVFVLEGVGGELFVHATAGAERGEVVGDLQRFSVEELTARLRAVSGNPAR